MELRRRISSFNAALKDIVQIYITYIRIIRSTVLSNLASTLTKEDSDNLERLQKNSLRNILKDKCLNYENIHFMSKMKEITLYLGKEMHLY